MAFLELNVESQITPNTVLRLGIKRLGKSLLIIKRLVSMFYYEKTYFFTEIEFFLASTSYKPQIQSDLV